MKNKNIKLGSYFVILSVLVILIVIVLNLLVYALPSRFRVFETDGYDIYDISDTTKELIGDIDEQIAIYLIAEDSGVDEKLSEFIDRYSQLNDNITYKVIDPVVYPEIATLSTAVQEISNLGENSVIVSSSVRDKILSYDEIYRVEYSQQDIAYYSMGYTPEGTVYFYGEDKLSGAIDYVLASSLPVLYIIEGHIEAQLGSDLEAYIESNNYTVSSLNILERGSIPTDASCLLMNCPESDISVYELELLTEYINGGGRLILVTDYVRHDGEFTNLKALCAQYNMDAIEGRVAESDPEYYNDSESLLLPKLSESDSITMSYVSYGIALTQASAFAVDDTSENVEVTKLITTSADAYTLSAYDAESEETEKLYEGECVLGAIASNTETHGSLVWYTSPSMTNDDSASYGGASSEITKMTLQSLCEKDTEISLMGKAVSGSGLLMTENDVNFWSTLLTVLVPLGVILIGIAVRYTRRIR